MHPMHTWCLWSWKEWALGPWNWSHIWSWATVWMVGTESSLSVRRASTLNHRAIFLAPPPKTLTVVAYTLIQFTILAIFKRSSQASDIWFVYSFVTSKCPHALYLFILQNTLDTQRQHSTSFYLRPQAMTLVALCSYDFRLRRVSLCPFTIRKYPTQRD